MVYVAGPFSSESRAGVESNIRHAVGYGLRLAQVGAFPVVPHANTSHPRYESLQPYTFWISGTMALLRACNGVLMVPGWERSSGARGEKAEAERLGLPVFTNIEQVQSWIPSWVSP
jgi:hypothetical protein